MQQTSLRSNDTFWICNLLNKYGCNSASIPDLLQAFINEQTPNDYYLPTNRCEYSIINMTYISQYVDLSLLSLLKTDEIAQLPCEILVQLNSDILQEKQIEHLVDFDYWSTNDTYLDCNDSLAIQCSHYIHNKTTNATNVAIDQCYLGDKCLYPFVSSKYLTTFPMVAGMCRCAGDCRLRPSKIELHALDAATITLSLCAFICLIIYCINVITTWFSTRKHVRINAKTANINSTPSLSNDIPPIIGGCLFLYLVFFSSPNNFNRTSFSCEDQNKLYTNTNPSAAVVGSTLPQSNYLCYISGAIIYYTLIMMFNYFGLLNFVIYRQLSNPLKPMWGIKKLYWHLLMISYGLILTVLMLKYGEIGADPTTGVCGPALNSLASMLCVIVPSLVSFVFFVIITPLNVFYIWKHVHYQNCAQQDLHLIHLYKRLIVYSICSSLSVMCFLYVWINTYFKWENTIKPIISSYYLCLFTNFQLTLSENEQNEIIKNGNLLQKMDHICILDPDNEFSALTASYLIVFIGVTLTALASMIFSCSLAKYYQWKNKILCIVTSCKCTNKRRGSRLEPISTDNVEMHKQKRHKETVLSASEIQQNVVSVDD